MNDKIAHNAHSKIECTLGVNPQGSRKYNTDKIFSLPPREARVMPNL